MPLKNSNKRLLSNVYPIDSDWRYIIYDALSTKGITITSLCKKAKVSNQAFYQALEGNGIRGFKLLKKLFSLLGFEVSLWVQIKDAKKGRTKVKREIIRFDMSTETHRANER